MGGRIFHIDRLNVGHRLILCFALIVLAMLAGDAMVLRQVDFVRAQAERLNAIDQKLIAVLRFHTSLLTFYDALEELAASEDAGRLATEGKPLRSAVVEEAQRAETTLSSLPPDLQGDPSSLRALESLQSALLAQLDAINALAQAGDWAAVHPRVVKQVRPLKYLSSALVDKVNQEVGAEQARILQETKHIEHRVFLIVPITAIVTLLIAGILGLTVTRSITQPLERLVEGSKALARGEFQHQVVIRGNDELARLGSVFNNTALRLRDLYASLQSSEDRLRLVIDTIPAHVWSALPDGSVDFLNQRWVEFTGLFLEAGVGWNWGSVVHARDLARFVDDWRSALKAGKPMETEVRLRRADGEYRWFLVRAVPLRSETGTIVKWYGILMDTEDRKRAEEALCRNQELLERHQTEISALNDRLMKAQEDERTRIAGELHDGVLQQLTSITLMLGAVKSEVPPDSEASKEIRGLQQRLIAAGKDIRQLSHELHPVVLQEGGLANALSTYCEEFGKTRGIPVSCETDASAKELSPGAALVLYRIAQEALGNVAKHSRAKHVQVQLTRSNSRVRLTVSDDGVGCAPDQAGKAGGLGLVNMRERVHHLNGTFEFESEPGRGTTVTAEVPFRPARDV